MGLDNRVARQKDELLPIINPPLPPEHVIQVKRVTEIITSMMTIDEHERLFEHVAHKAAALFRAEDCSLFWINRERNTIDLRASHSIPIALLEEKVTPISAQPKAGFPAYVAATSERLCFISEDYKDHPAWDGSFRKHLAHLPSQRCSSLVIHPITDQYKNILGVIKIENKVGVGQEEGFTPLDQEILALLAIQVAVAFRKIHLYQIAKMMTQTVDLRMVLSCIAKSAFEVVSADLAAIFPYDTEKGELLLEETVIYGQRTDVRASTKPRESGITLEALRSHTGYVVIEDLNQQPERLSDFVRQEGLRSTIVIALKVQNEPVGVLYCSFRRPRQFPLGEIRNVQTFGELAASAIHNAKVFMLQNRTVKALSAVQRLTHAALAKQKLDSVLKTILDTVCDTLGYEMCTISLVNEARNTIETCAAKGDIPNEWLKMAKHSLDDGDIQSFIVRTGKTQVIAGWDERFDLEMYERFGHEGIIRVFTPIRGRERVIGTVEAGYDRTHKSAITPQDVKTLQTYLEQVALVIENVRLLEQERLRAAQLQKLLEMSQQIDQAVSQEDISNIFKLTADMAVMVAGTGTSAAIYYYDDQLQNTLLMQPSSGADEELLQRHAAFAPRPHAQVISSAKRFVREGRYASDDAPPSVCIPLRASGTVLGVLCVVYDQPHMFIPGELDNLELCAAQAAMAISIARVHQQLATRLDGLSVEIGQFYHLGIGQHLANVSQTLENLRDGVLGPLSPKQVERITTAFREAATLREQITRLLRLREFEEKTFTLVLKETDLCGLVQDAIESVKMLINEKHIDLSCNIDGLTCVVELDRGRIKEVLVNLLDNAIKFTQQGGRIEVQGYQCEHEVAVSICDMGRGIALEHRGSIFEKYFQITPLIEATRVGVGLGLYLVQKFVDMHGGRITIESELGKGSTFTIFLPK